MYNISFSAYIVFLYVPTFSPVLIFDVVYFSQMFKTIHTSFLHFSTCLFIINLYNLLFSYTFILYILLLFPNTLLFLTLSSFTPDLLFWLLFFIYSFLYTCCIFHTHIFPTFFKLNSLSIYLFISKHYVFLFKSHIFWSKTCFMTLHMIYYFLKN